MPLCSRHTCNLLTDVSSHATVRLYTTDTQNSSNVESFYCSALLADSHTNKSHSLYSKSDVVEHVYINLKSRASLDNLINQSADYEIYRLLSCEVISFGIYRDFPTLEGYAASDCKVLLTIGKFIQNYTASYSSRR